MKIEYQRKLISNKYYQLEIHNIPTELIKYAAVKGYNLVTIENFSHYYFPELAKLTLDTGSVLIRPTLKTFNFDFQLSNTEFLNLVDVWNKQGCYAIFHNKPIKFKATDLLDAARYRALDNFDWNLEIAVPSGASDGLGQITSPDKTLIDKIEQEITSDNKS